MIEEDYVNSEIAELLKEKGFDEPTVFRYGDYPDNNDLLFAPSGMAIVKNSETQPYFYSAPTLQMTMKWLREIHKLFISIQLHMDGSYVWYIYRVDCTPKGCDRNPHNYSYEQACEAAIKYCLENLI